LVATCGCGSALRRTEAGTPAPASSVPGSQRSALPIRPVARRCFGAAAVDPAHRCPISSLSVVPAPGAAPPTPVPCPQPVFDGPVHACFWGAKPGKARRTVALIGDSHASVWRPAMRRVAAAKHWRVISISRAGCPLTLAHPLLPGRERTIGCMGWNREVLRHTANSLVFTAAHRSRVRGGPDSHAAQLTGYTQALRALVRGGVGRVVVLRDTPRNAAGTFDCIRRAVGLGRPPGRACAVPRRYALRHDPLAQAAARMRSPRVKVIDLTWVMCSAHSCFPVVGGALVLRDRQHMSERFSTTMGPFLLRAIDGL
jgi:hypothetical protein